MPSPSLAGALDPTASPTPGATQTTWVEWLKSIAQTAGAASWTPALAGNPGCALASWSVGTTKFAVTKDTFVDATTSGCSTVSLQNLTVDLKADLTLKVSSLASTNGLRVTASDGQPHRLTVVATGATGSLIKLVGPTAVDPNVAVDLTSAGTVQLDGSTDLTGSIQAARLATSGAVKVHAGATP